MKPLNLSLIVVSVALIAATTSAPTGERYFSQSTPPNAQLLQLLGRSHISMVSDLVWIRAIGLSIDLRVPADGLALIAWCRLATDLDPKFVWPYIFGGLLGTMSYASGDFNVKEAEALLQRGEEQLPNDFRLPLYLSFNQLHLEHDVEAAAQTLRRGARIPGAPTFMALLATRLLAQTNAFDAAHEFAEQLEAQASDPSERAFFQRRRQEIERDERLVLLQHAVDAFRAAKGRVPQTLSEVQAEGFLTEVPVDPLGGQFLLDANGAVTATSGARLQAHFQEGAR